MSYTAENYIEFIEWNRRDKLSQHGLESVAKEFRTMQERLKKLESSSRIIQRSESLKDDYTKDFIEWKEKYVDYIPMNYDYKSKVGDTRYTLSDLTVRYQKAMNESAFNDG